MSDIAEQLRDFVWIGPEDQMIEAASDVMEAAADEIERLREALEEIACRHVRLRPLWWQERARAALKR